VGGAVGVLLVFGCTITVVNDFPGEKGWGTDATATTTAAGGSGGGTTPQGGQGGSGLAANCIDCHGNEDNAAPPLDMNGFDDPSLLSVGAHQEHLLDSDWRGPIACTECHTVPSSNICPNYQESHCDGKMDVIFGPLADADGAVTTYDAGSGVCANNFCHGATLEPDYTGLTSLREPVFNVVDGTYSACGTACHTNPPGDPHPTGTNCGDALCHGMVITTFDDTTTPPTVTWADATRHIDGIVDFVPPP
jgi:hypothetical protein